jgi:hypothetical protein
MTSGNLVATIIAGGTASVVGGGKFGNGALTAGFGYLYNYCHGHSFGCQLEKASNALKIVFGSVTTATGAAICTGVVTCIVGAPVALIGASQAIEGTTYFKDSDIEGAGFNPAREAIRSVAPTPQVGDRIYAGAEIAASLSPLSVSTIVVRSAGSSYYLYQDVPKVVEMTGAGAAKEVGSNVANSYQVFKQDQSDTKK